MRWRLVGALLLIATAAAAAPANVVYVFLDTTRADQFGAWGNPRRTTPVLDDLAAHGIMFAQHFANSHATRPSVPQLMSGRYYHRNVLRVFRPDADPREFSFVRADPTAILLPAVLRGRGYRTLGVSAHPWMVADSELGRQFDQLDFVAAKPSRGHADAAEVVDRAIAVWRGRDVTRPTFLYVHLMDMHVPRYLPEGEPRFPVEGFDWRARFDDACWPRFGRDARLWWRPEARDFTDADRRHFTAVYDTRLSYADEHLGRLITAVRDGDPDLQRTLFVVVADHGEELGEEGRTDHSDALADGVQHVPWIVAGGGVPAGQRAERFTENIDVAPTLLALLHVPLPPGTHMDGRAQTGPDGRLRPGKAAVYYAWEDYRGIRTRRWLLRERVPDSTLSARCLGPTALYRVHGATRLALDVGTPEADAVVTRLHARLERRLERRARAFARTRSGPAAAAFVVRQDYWIVGADAAIACAPIDGFADPGRLGVPGWLWSGRGVALLDLDGAAPLPIEVAAPDGEYRIDVGAVPVEPMPWLFGRRRWRRNGFLPNEPAAWVPLGEARASGGLLAVSLPAARLRGTHLLGLRLSPPGAAPAPSPPAADDDLQKRLRALGYVQ